MMLGGTWQRRVPRSRTMPGPRPSPCCKGTRLAQMKKGAGGRPFLWSDDQAGQVCGDEAWLTVTDPRTECGKEDYRLDQREEPVRHPLPSIACSADGGVPRSTGAVASRPAARSTPGARTRPSAPAAASEAMRQSRAQRVVEPTAIVHSRPCRPTSCIEPGKVNVWLALVHSRLCLVSPAQPP
jgi:hypothetical protein